MQAKHSWSQKEGPFPDIDRRQSSFAYKNFRKSTEWHKQMPFKADALHRRKFNHSATMSVLKEEAI